MDGAVTHDIPPDSTTSSSAIHLISESPLTIGATAPPFVVKHWLVGDALDHLARGKVHVVEFWATWSGNHWEQLSELAGKFPEIEFISIGIWDESIEGVRDYVRNHADSIKLRIGWDEPVPGTKDKSGKIAHDWMESFGENGLPLIFVVDSSSLVSWIGQIDRLENILIEIRSGRYKFDKSSRLRERALQRLEIEPTTEIDSKMFISSFECRPPSLRSCEIDWLEPDIRSKPELSTVSQPTSKNKSLLSRLFGRSKQDLAEAVQDVPNSPTPVRHAYGPPDFDRPLAVVIADAVTERSLEPGWQVLNLPELNTLPHAFADVEFVSLIKSIESLRTTYGKDYCEELALWCSELGWHLGTEVEASLNIASDGAEIKPGTAKQNFVSFLADHLMLRTLPAAVFLDQEGALLWAGSPLRLSEALEKWRSGELSVSWASEDLVYWYRLLASCAANERLAGVGRYFSRQMMNADSRIPFESDHFRADQWEEIVVEMKRLLPWRAHDWRVFDFKTATQRQRGMVDDGARSQSILTQFEELTNTFENEFRTMDPLRIEVYDYDPLTEWRTAILVAIEHLGLLKEGIEPLEGPELFAVENHPLTHVILDSAKRLEKCKESIPDPAFYEPSVWPVLMLRLGHSKEAEEGFDAEIRKFDVIIENLREVANPEQFTTILGTEPDDFRQNLLKMKDLCRR